MNHEVQQALSRKADDWQLNALRQEVDSLKHENRELREKIGYAEGKLQNHYSAIERLIQLLIDSDKFSEVNQLFEIKQYL